MQQGLRSSKRNKAFPKNTTFAVYFNTSHVTVIVSLILYLQHIFQLPIADIL